MSDLNLHLEHRMVCDLRIAERDPVRNVLVFLVKDEAYCTYRVDPEGNCYMGHYGMRTVQDGVKNLMERACVPVATHDSVAGPVLEMAERIFDECGAKDDFCVQYIGDVIVFGGTNRLVLNSKGWFIDREYCTERFIKLFDARSN